MYFIERGQVEHWATTMQGPILLETLGPSDFFGEIALLSGKGHPTTAYALVNTDIWVLIKADFEDFLQRYPNLAVTFSRILSERLEQTMGRLRGAAPQRGLPAGTGPAANPPFQPGPTAQPGPVNPSRPVAMPPVRVHRVSSSPDSRSLRPVRALPSQTNPTQGMPPQPPPIHSQHTQAITPIPVNPRPGPSPHSQFTQGMPPQRPPVHAQNTLGMPAIQPGGFSRPTQPLPTHRPEPAPSRGKSSSQKAKKRDSRPASASRSRPVSKQNPAQAKREKARRPSGSVSGSVQASARPNSQAYAVAAPNRLLPAPPNRMLPRSVSNRKIGQYRNSFSTWFAHLSLGARLRLLAVLLLIIWLCGIMAPYWIIRLLGGHF